jgi:hypothetical protein
MIEDFLEKVRKRRKATLIVLFTFSFVYTLYVSFPYGVFKGFITNKIAELSGIQVDIGEIGAAIPFGLVARQIRIHTEPQELSVILDELKLSINPFRFLILDIGVGISLRQGGGQHADLNLVIPILGLFSHGLPSHVGLYAEGYPMTQIFNYALNFVAKNPNANPLLAQALGGIEFEGALYADTQIKLNPDDVTQSSGNLQIQLKESKFRGTSLDMVEQNFSKFLVEANIARGVIQVSHDSGIVSDELNVQVGGKVNLKERLPSSVLDLELGLKLSGELEKNFGFILTGLLGGSGDSARMKILGTLEQPRQDRL